MMSASVARGMPMRSRMAAAPRRWQPRLPSRRIPVAAIVVSILGHILTICLVAIAVMWTSWNTQKVHIVNLVPTIAAVGSPRAPAAPPLPSRPTVPLAARAPILPPTERPRPEPVREPAKLPEPARLPEAPRTAAPALPSRAALMRPGERELPPLSNPTTPRPPTAERGERPVEKPAEPRPAPSAALGLPTGSAAGVGARSIDVSDFPHAWYLRQVLQKIQAQWERQGLANQPDQIPQIFVEIQRDGSVRAPRIEKSSGNSLYDRAALRAVMEASPFPPLPQDWSKSSLRVLFTFELEPRRS